MADFTDQPSFPGAFIDSPAEGEARRLVETRRYELMRALDAYVEASVKYEVRKSLCNDLPPRWLDLTKPDDLNARKLVLNYLKYKGRIGSKLREIHRHLLQSGKIVKKSSITTILTRLKSDGKILRDAGGIWKMAEFS